MRPPTKGIEMPECIKCGFKFRGLGRQGSPYQNEFTGQWICYMCYDKLDPIDKEKYHLI